MIVFGLCQTIKGATIKAAEVSPYPDAAELVDSVRATVSSK